MSSLLWNCCWVILNRLFVFHFIIGLIIGLFIVIHLLLLHNYSSTNSFINSNSFIISFYPFLIKDLMVGFAVLIPFVYYLMIDPDKLGNKDNQIIANPLKTPINILPE